MTKAKEHPEETEHPDEIVATTLGGLAKPIRIPAFTTLHLPPSWNASGNTPHFPQ